MMWSPRSRHSKTRKAGDEAFCVRGENLEFAVLDYWRWANSDLLDNAARGVLAEFLVANAVNQTNPVASGVRSMSEPRAESESR